MRTSVALALTLFATPLVAQTPKIVTDIPALHSLSAAVMGDLGAPVLLLDQGADPHHFQMRPSQARALAQADMVIWIGPEMSPWLERSLNNTSAISMELLHLPQTSLRDMGDMGDAHDDHEDHDDHVGHDDHGDHEAHGDHDDHVGHDDHDDHEAHDDHAEHDGHDHDGVDPHAWLSPDNAIAWITVIADALADTDPENAATYQMNAQAARTKIEQAQTEAAHLLAPAKDVAIMVFHDAYGYFAHAFDLHIAGTVTMGDAAKPGAGHLSDLRQTLEHEQITCIFPEAQHDPAYVAALVEGTNTRVGAALDPSGSALPFGPDLYPALITGLAQAIADCVTAPQ